MTELAFFTFGILPYWYTLWMPAKTVAYWCLLAWCCLIFIAYFAHHGATAAVVNNVVELGLSGVGLWRIRRGL